jgi:hypothetical protein
MNTCVWCFHTVVQEPESGAWVLVGEPFQHFEDHQHSVTATPESLAELAEYAGAA